MEYENALIAAGETVLRDNRFPSAEELSLVTSNASTGHDLMLLGMATDCARSLRDSHKTLVQLQAMLTSPKLLATLNFDQKLALTRTIMDFSKYQHGFLKDVHERVDIAKLQVDMLANDNKVKQSDGYTKEEKMVLRQKLTQIIDTTRTYTKNALEEVPSAEEL